MKFGSGLSKKLLIRILLLSTIFTTIFTGISFYIDYKSEMNLLDATFHQIEISTLDSLIKDVYEVDEEGYQVNLRSVLQISDIVEVKLVSETNKTLFHQYKNDTIQEYIIKKKYPLTYKLGNRLFDLGHLEIKATKKNIYDRLRSRFFYFFITQAVKTGIVSALILWVFNFYVIRHLKLMTEKITEFDRTNHNESILLEDREKTAPDEIDYLAKKLNILMENFVQNMQKKDSEVEAARLKVIASTRLAALGEMASGIAHEINNPLLIINLNTEILDKIFQGLEVESRANVLTHLQTIKNTVFRINNIIESLREVSKNEKLDDHVESNVNDIVQMTSHYFQEKSKNLGIKFIVEINNPHNELLVCSPSQVSKLLFNVLNNAFDAAYDSDERWVKLSVEECNQFFTFKISDSGNGVEAENVDRVFNPFFTTKEVGKAIGLGLTISRTIATECGGELYYDDRAEYPTFVFKILKEV